MGDQDFVQFGNFGSPSAHELTSMHRELPDSSAPHRQDKETMREHRNPGIFLLIRSKNPQSLSSSGKGEEGG